VTSTPTRNHLDFSVLSPTRASGRLASYPRVARPRICGAVRTRSVKFVPPPLGQSDAPLNCWSPTSTPATTSGRISRSVRSHGVSDRRRWSRSSTSSTTAVQHTKVTKLYSFDGLKRVDIQEAAAGYIVCLPGSRHHEDLRDDHRHGAPYCDPADRESTSRRCT